MRWLTIYGTCFAALAIPTSAAAADLLEVFALARTRDPVYGAARATWAAAQERIPQARAGLLPNASLSATTQYTDRSTRFRDGLTARNSADFASSSISLSVTQGLFRLPQLVAYRQALTQSEQADAQLALAAQDLIVRVAQAYFDVLFAQDTVAFSEAQKAAIGQQLAQAKRNFEVGTTSITDMHEAQARYDLTAAQEIAARSELELRRRALQQLIARSAPPLAPLGPRLVLKSPDPSNMEEWAELAQRANLQVRIAQSALMFATQEIDRSRAARYPTLDAFATGAGNTAGSQTVNGVPTDSRTASVGLQLAVPLYQGGALTSRVRESIANEDRAREDLENARRTAEFNARQAYVGITNGIAQVRALEAAVASTDSQLRSTRLGQQVGLRTQVDVLNAQQLLFSARRDLAQSRYTYILSLLRLEGAVGELTEEDIAGVNRWLLPAEAGALR